LSDAFEHFLRSQHEQSLLDEQRVVDAQVVAQQILRDCTDAQANLVRYALKGSDYISVRCPRRAGKTYAMTALAIVVGLLKPGSRVLIVSLTLKSTRENYWAGAPAGVFYFNNKYNLGLKFNHTDSVWEFPNGSRGRLAGAETRSDIEYLRGAAAEADLAILDECKSFAPSLLAELIRDVIEPGLMTRQGKLVMGGTPGHIPTGVFWEATDPRSFIDVGEVKGDGSREKQPTCIRFSDLTNITPEFFEEELEVQSTLPEDDDIDFDNIDEDDVAVEPWILHSWALRDNTKTRAGKKAWLKALRIKKRNGWADDNPTWRREYLGEWVEDQGGLVYMFAALRNKQLEVPTGEHGLMHVSWVPRRTPQNPTGLPQELGPWNLVMGLDFGLEDKTAIVVAAYSESCPELRVVYTHKESHLSPDDVAALINDTIRRFGAPAYLIGDAGSLGGKVYVDEIARRHGIIIEAAKKTDKFEYVEWMNSDFHAGRIKLILGDDLDKELCGLQWDLKHGSKADLLRTGKKLQEDPLCPNHLADALLYLWRSAHHFFAVERTPPPARHTPAWFAQREKDAEQRLAHEKRAERRFSTDGLATGAAPITRENVAWTTALHRHN
jgi:hypothetical protein